MVPPLVSANESAGNGHGCAFSFTILRFFNGTASCQHDESAGNIQECVPVTILRFLGGTGSRLDGNSSTAGNGLGRALSIYGSSMLERYRLFVSMARTSQQE